MKNGLIGIMPLYDKEKESYWMLPNYMNGIIAGGGIPIMLPLTKDTLILDYFIDLCDGFLLTGGQDVNPNLYNEDIKKYCGEINDDRDFMDSYVLKEAIRLDKAVLGICRGIQIMNATFGGSLYQDLPKEHKSIINHHMDKPYDKHAHYVNIDKNTTLYKIVNTTRLSVNSYHHQAIKNLAKCYRSMAFSDDLICEAIEMKDKKFVVGIQWHPEFSYMTHKDSLEIFKYFISKSKEE